MPTKNYTKIAGTMAKAKEEVEGRWEFTINTTMA